MAFLVPITAIAEPNNDKKLYELASIKQIQAPTYPILKSPVELTSAVLSNCYLYVKTIYPSTPSTKTILANLGESGEVGVLYYASSDLYHYVVVEKVEEGQVTFTETNFNGHKKSARTLPSASFVGFYKL